MNCLAITGRKDKFNYRLRQLDYICGYALEKRKRELYRRGSIYCSDGSWNYIYDPVSDLVAP